MSNTSEWSTTAATNNSAPPNGWPENMQRSAVNDCAREMMAALAKWYQDQRGSLITAGGTTAYTLTTNNAHTALSDIPLMVVRANAANTGASTLNVDGLGALSLTKANGVALSAGDFTTNKLYLLAYNSGASRFEILNTMTGDVSAFASTTAMLFAQTAAPTGWTKSVTDNDKALRLVSGTASSGGTTPFSSVLASRTILLANLPSTNLSLASLTGSVGTGVNVSNGSNVWNGGGDGANVVAGGGATPRNASQANVSASLASGAVTFGGNIPLGGSGTAMDFAVQYVDVIKATKD
jgi:hypothetical protein